MRLKQVLLIVLTLSSVFLISGCLPIQSTEEKIHQILESVVEKEKVFEEQQDPLVKLENEEQKLYEEIMKLGTKNLDEIVEKSDAAIEVVEKRMVHMKEEQKSLEESKQEFERVKPLINKIEEKAAKDKAEELYSIMMERYKTHDQLYTAYMKGLEFDKELYNMLKDEERSLDELEDQIVKINNIYQEVITANEKFNALTKEYNDTKHSFYQLSGLDFTEEST